MISKLAKLIRDSDHVLALTGAGISTDSGIPDFRSKNSGLWEKHDPAKMASKKFMLKNPKEFYKFHVPLWKKYTKNAKPNIAHIVLAEMEKQGLLKGVITQNIDGLHYKAGSRNLYEVHGHLRSYRCMKCGKDYEIDIIYEKFQQGQIPFKCDSCDGTLRTNVVLFGDKMNQDFYDALVEARSCDLLIVVGSSLRVYPVAGIPELCQRFAIINREPTPKDRKADIVIHDNVGKVFRKLAEELDIDIDSVN